MGEQLNIEAVIISPTPVGVVLLTGAAQLVADAIADLDLEFEYYVRHADQDGAGVTCMRIDLTDDPVEAVQHSVERALIGLIERNSELEGWTPRITLVGEPLDDDGTSSVEDFETEADQLLPSGDEIVSELMRAIHYERSIYDDAKLFRAVPIENLCPDELRELDAKGRDAALHQASALAGCLIHASVIVVDQLIDDITKLREHRDDAEASIDDTWVLSDLPSRFAGKYDSLFAQKFLVALVDVTTRFTRSWQPLSCVAQELGLRILLDRVEIVADSADVVLDDGWRADLEELLFEDLDHEFLYDPALDGFEDEKEVQPSDMAPMRFDDWVRPFNSERSLPPYSLDT